MYHQRVQGVTRWVCSAQFTGFRDQFAGIATGDGWHECFGVDGEGQHEGDGIVQHCGWGCGAEEGRGGRPWD